MSALKIKCSYQCESYYGDCNITTDINDKRFRYFRNQIIKKIHNSNLDCYGNGLDEVVKTKCDNIGIKLQDRMIRHIFSEK